MRRIWGAKVSLLSSRTPRHMASVDIWMSAPPNVIFWHRILDNWCGVPSQTNCGSTSCDTQVITRIFATSYVSRNVINNYRNKSYNKSTTNRELMQLEDYSWPTVYSEQPRRIDRRRCRQQARPSTSFVVCRQQDRLAVAKFSKSKVWDKVP